MEPSLGQLSELPATSLIFGSASVEPLSNDSAPLASLATVSRKPTLPSYLQVLPPATTENLMPSVSTSVPVIVGRVPSIELYDALNGLPGSTSTVTVAETKPNALHPVVLASVIVPTAAPTLLATLSLRDPLSVTPEQAVLRNPPSSSKLMFVPVLSAAPGFDP